MGVGCGGGGVLLLVSAGFGCLQGHDLMKRLSGEAVEFTILVFLIVDRLC